MSDPKPLSAFVQQCQSLIDRIRASEDTNEKRMLELQLRELLMRARG